MWRASTRCGRRRAPSFGQDGPFLFGADSARPTRCSRPWSTRLLTYAPPVSAGSRAYCQAVRAHALVARVVRGCGRRAGGLAAGEIREPLPSPQTGDRHGAAAARGVLARSGGRHRAAGAPAGPAGRRGGRRAPAPGGLPRPALRAGGRAVWPPFGRVDRYMAGVVRTLRRLRPGLVEVHNRANLACASPRPAGRARGAVPAQRSAGHARRPPPAERAALLRRMTRGLRLHLPGRALHGRRGRSDTAPSVLPNALDLASLPPRRAAGDGSRPSCSSAAWWPTRGPTPSCAPAPPCCPACPAGGPSMIGADRFRAGSRPRRSSAPWRPGRGRRHRAAGYLPHADVLAAMARAAIVVVPSRWPEPFGLTALEAMASGAALVCSAPRRPAGGGGRGGLYAEPDAPGALDAAIARLARDGRCGPRWRRRACSGAAVRCAGRAGAAGALRGRWLAHLGARPLRTRLALNQPKGRKSCRVFPRTGTASPRSPHVRHPDPSHRPHRLPGRRQDHAAQPHPHRGSRPQIRRGDQRVRRAGRGQRPGGGCRRGSVRDEQRLHLLHRARRPDPHRRRPDEAREASSTASSSRPPAWPTRRPWRRRSSWTRACAPRRGWTRS